MASRTGRAEWAGVGAWLALAGAGFGAALQLIDTPRAVAGFQHYRLDAGGAARTVAWIVLAVQGLLLATAGRRHVRDFLALVRASPWPALAVLVLMTLTAAAPSADPRRYISEILLATLIQLVALLTVFAAVRSLPAGAGERLVERVLGPADAPGPTRVDRWALTVAAAVLAVAVVLVWAVYENHPHVPDEVVYLLQAKYLAAGRWWLPLPPVPEAFLVDLMQYEPTRWYSPVPPGWPLVLAIGAKLGVPWLVNPALGAVAVLLAYRLLGTMYPLRTTRLATLLLAFSPWFLFMAMNFMTHTFTLVCALLAALGVARARRDGAVLPAFTAGLAVGVVSLIRPLEGLALALLMGLWSLGARGRGLRRLAPAAALTVGAALMGAAVLPYNARLTGDARKFPIMAYNDKYYGPGSNDLGFGPNRGLGWGGSDPFPGHSPLESVINTIVNGFQINVELLGWPTGAAVVVALAVAFGMRRMTRADWWQLAVIAVVVGMHAYYWFAGGPDFGARYWYLVIIPCVALAARGLEQADVSLARAGSGTAGARATALALCAMSLAVYVPWRSLDKYRHYRGMRPDVRELAQQHAFGRSLVLVRGPRHPDYMSAAAYNPIDIRADAPVYAWDTRLAIREQVIRAYADRPVWFMDGPSLTGAGYRVIAGPLTAEEALASRIPVDILGDELHAYDPVNPPKLRGER